MTTQRNFGDLNPVVPGLPSNTDASCPSESGGPQASRRHSTYAPSPATSGGDAQFNTKSDSDQEDTTATRCQYVKSLLELSRIFLSQRLARAEQLFLRGRLPEAVISHSVSLRGSFQRKALGLLLLQTLGTLAGASLVAFLDALHPAPGVLLGLFCVFTGISYLFASLERLVFPWNYITLATLTISAGVSFGLMTKKLRIMHELIYGKTPAVQELQLVFLISYAAALLVASLLVLFGSRRHTMRMSVATTVAVIATDVVLCAIWAQTRFCNFGWLCGMIVVLSASVLWLGIDMDRLLSKLMIDEYVLPALLVWADLLFLVVMGGFVALFYILVVGDVGCESWQCLCDCWLEDPPEPVPDASPPALDAPQRVDLDTVQAVPEQARMAWDES